MSKIVAVVRDRENGDPVVGETVTFRNPGGSSIGTDDTGADGSATYEANGNPAGLITWDVSVSGDTRKAGARAQRQIGAFFETELPAAFGSIVSNGYGSGLGDECAVIPGSGRQLVVGTGGLWVLGVFFRFYTTSPLAVDANATGSTRLDRVVLRCDFDETSATYGMGVLTWLIGTTSLPAINSDEAGDYDYVLANVTVPNGFASFTGGNITDMREVAGPFAIPSGATLTNPTISLPAFGVTLSQTELSYLDGGTSNFQTQIAAKAAAADVTAGLALKAAIAGQTFTGPVAVDSDSTTAFHVRTAGGTAILTINGATGEMTLGGYALTLGGPLNHDGSTVGFYGSAPVAQGPNLTNRSSATISTTTWGSGEAAVLESLRTAFNELATYLASRGDIAGS